MESLNIDVPDRILSRIEERVEETEFRSTEEYIVFVLGEVCENNCGQERSLNSNQDVEDRLESLGYL